MAEDVIDIRKRIEEMRNEVSSALADGDEVVIPSAPAGEVAEFSVPGVTTTATARKTEEPVPDKVAMQLNDTHPSIAVAELMRILMDKYSLGWSLAWGLITKIFAYTNHTVLPEALEKWSVSLMQSLVPRVAEIIFEINRRWLLQVKEVFDGDSEMMSKLSIVEGEGEHQMFRMAHLAIVGSFKVNGVAAIHAEIVKEDVFPQFVEFYKRKGINDKFIGITNGVTCRRWMAQCNPELSSVITKALGSDRCL